MGDISDPMVDSQIQYFLPLLLEIHEARMDIVA